MSAKSVLSEEEAYDLEVKILEKIGDTVEDLLERYIVILKDVKEKKIMEGTGADNIADFADVLKENLTGKFSAPTDTQKKAVQDFIFKIDEADKKTN